jgi:hypothetical protein
MRVWRSDRRQHRDTAPGGNLDIYRRCLNMHRIIRIRIHCRVHVARTHLTVPKHWMAFNLAALGAAIIHFVTCGALPRHIMIVHPLGQPFRPPHRAGSPGRQRGAVGPPRRLHLVKDQHLTVYPKNLLHQGGVWCVLAVLPYEQAKICRVAARRCRTESAVMTTVAPVKRPER